MEVEEGAAVRACLTERSTMIILGPALAILGIGFLCWLVFTLAVYALPFFVYVAGHIMQSVFSLAARPRG